MAAATRLSNHSIDAIRPPPKGEVFVWDSSLKGFGIRVKSSGARTYLIQYRTEDGRSRRYRLGQHGPLTPDQARRLALVKLGEVAQGRDPAGERRRTRASITVGELCDLYVNEGLMTRKPASVASARADVDNHIKPLMGRELASRITPEDVDRLLLDVAAGKTARIRKTGFRGVSRVRGGKGAANAAVTTLCAAMNFGIRRGVRPDNPALGVRKFPERKLERFLSPAELGRLGEALAAAEALGVESRFAIAAIRLLILTGARRNEILTLKRSWIDLHNRCLRLPDSKTGSKVVHIGAAALEVIQAVPAVEGNPYLLPGRNGEGRLVDLQATWERIRKAAAIPDVRLHDLRHAFASLGATSGDSLLIIGSLLGHRSAKTTQRYTHLADDPLKDAADRISAEVARLMGLNRQPEVSPSRRAQVIEAPPGTAGVLGEVIETRWVDTKAAAAFLGHTVGTLQTYRWMGTGPRFRRIGRRIVYAMGDLEAWRREHAGEGPREAVIR